MKRTRAWGEAGWAFAGLFISYQIIKAGYASLFGYPLLVFSLMLLSLAAWHLHMGK